MPFTPWNIVSLARLALVLGVALLLVLLLGPFQGLEARFVPWDKAAHFMAFYALTATTFLAFPHRRRADMAVAIIAFGLATEIVQGWVGRDCDMYDWAADAIGALSLVAPMFFETLRQGAREFPHHRFGAFSLGDRRRAKIVVKTAPAPAAMAPLRARAVHVNAARPAPVSRRSI